MVAKKLNEPLTEPGIKRMLRQRSSQQYFKDGGWTHNPQEADHFADVVQVAKTCVQYDLKGVELALRYETASSDLFCTVLR